MKPDSTEMQLAMMQFVAEYKRNPQKLSNSPPKNRAARRVALKSTKQRKNKQ